MCGDGFAFSRVNRLLGPIEAVEGIARRRLSIKYLSRRIACRSETLQTVSTCVRSISRALLRCERLRYLVGAHLSRCEQRHKRTRIEGMRLLIPSRGIEAADGLASLAPVRHADRRTTGEPDFEAADGHGPEKLHKCLRIKLHKCLRNRGCVSSVCGPEVLWRARLLGGGQLAHKVHLFQDRGVGGLRRAGSRVTAMPYPSQLRARESRQCHIRVRNRNQCGQKPSLTVAGSRVGVESWLNPDLYLSRRQGSLCEEGAYGVKRTMLGVGRPEERKGRGVC